MWRSAQCAGLAMWCGRRMGSSMCQRARSGTSPSMGEAGRGWRHKHRVCGEIPPPCSITDLARAKSYLASLPTRGRVTPVGGAR